MKRKIVAVLLSICCVAVLLTGCGSSSSGGGKVTLAESDYKGIEVAEVIADEVTEEAVDEEIQAILEDNAETEEITDRAVKDGDIANIDYVGKVDGKEFDGGSAEGYDLEIGSDTFITGFEEQIIGHSIGEEFDINVTFPEEYQSEELAGKDAVFTIKLNAITVQKIPELTDDFVASVSENSSNVEEYKNEIREQLEADNQADAESTFEENVLQAVLDKAEVSEYDEDKLAELKKQSKDYYEQIITMYYGMTMKDYLEQAGESEEDFDKEIEEQCKETLKMEMVCEYIAKEQGLEIADEEFNEKLETMVEENGYESADSLIEDYAGYYETDGAETSGEADSEGEDTEDSVKEVSDEAKEKAREELKKSFLQEKVASWIVENAKKGEPVATDTEE